MKKNILLVVVDCLRADFIYADRGAKTLTISKLRKEGYSFLNTIAATSTTTPSFAALLTGFYPFENGIRSLSGHTLKKGIKILPELLKEAGYHTYAEVTGPLTREAGLDMGFKEYNYRDKKMTVHTAWGEEFIERFRKGHYKEPYFVLLHVWPLHEPRAILEECNNDEHGREPYGRALSSIDKYLGRLLRNIGEDTVVILTGDHGEQIEDFGLGALYKRGYSLFFKGIKKLKLINTPFAKGVRDYQIGHGYGVYDILVKIPLIFHNTGLPAGESGRQVRQIDTASTILDIAGIGGVVNQHGKSLLPLMENKKEEERDAYIEATGMIIPDKNEWIAGIRTEKYKYMYYPFKEEYCDELYDLENDPCERKNIADSNRETVSMLRKKIESLKAESLTGEEINGEDLEKMKKRLADLGYFD